jgi:hypothetical protein
MNKKTIPGFFGFRDCLFVLKGLLITETTPVGQDFAEKNRKFSTKQEWMN